MCSYKEDINLLKRLGLEGVSFMRRRKSYHLGNHTDNNFLLERKTASSWILGCAFWWIRRHNQNKKLCTLFPEMGPFIAFKQCCMWKHFHILKSRKQVQLLPIRHTSLIHVMLSQFIMATFDPNPAIYLWKKTTYLMLNLIHPYPLLCVKWRRHVIEIKALK